MTSIQYRMPASRHSLWQRLVMLSVLLIGVPTFSPESVAQSPDMPPLLSTDAVGRGSPVAASSELQRFNRSEFDSGSVAWMLVSAASCLFLLTPGLLLFYCGLLRTPGAATLMIRYLGVVAVLSIAWVLWIYSFAFSRNAASHDVLQSERTAKTQEPGPGDHLLGRVLHLGFRGLDSQLGNDGPSYPLRRPTDRIPHLLFMICQLMFFVSVPVPLLVPLHRRLSWGVLTVIAVLWGTIVYAPSVFWIWAGGSSVMVLDAAGALPAHVSVGFSALIAAWFSGRETRPDEHPELTSRINYMGLGAVLFWGGSLIWNASRSLSADGFAVNSLVVTHLAACGGLAGWCGTDWLIRGRVGLISFCAGPVVGLVSIASGSGYVAPPAGILIGSLGGAVACCAYATIRKHFPGNQMLVVFGLHAVGGILGTLLTGVLATASVAGFDQSGNPISGLIEGDLSRPVSQVWGIVSTAFLAIFGTLVIVLVLRIASRIHRQV